MSRRDEREILRRLSDRRPERRDLEPPADLLERLRAEIPAEVRVQPNATRRESGGSPTVRQRWLIAASLTAMVGMGLFSLHVLDSGKEEDKAASRVSPAMPPPEVQPAPAAASPSSADTAAPQAVPELRHRLAGPPPAKPRQKERADAEGAPGGAPGSAPAEPAPPTASASAPPPAPVQAPASAERAPAEGALAEGVPGGVVGGVPGGVAGGVPGGVAGGAGRAAKEDRPASPEPAAKSEMKRPMAKLAQPAREENRADLLARSEPVAEGAPAPLAGDDRRWLLLFRLEGLARTGARAEVTFDPAVVARSRQLAAGADRLYEVKLRPGTAAGATIATLTRLSPGAPPHILRTLRVADLTPSWEQASPGFRLASLSAELEEVLAGARPRSALPELLHRAQTLAGELPGDPRATDLLHRIEQAGAP